MANRICVPVVAAGLLLSSLVNAAVDAPGASRGATPTVTEVLALRTTVVGDGFGSMIATDGNVVVVGAQGGQNNQDANAVYIYERSDIGLDDWQEVRRILPPRPTPVNDISFPNALALQSDVLYVGDSLDEVVSIYQRDLGGPSNWGLAGTVAAPDSFEDSDFGIAVAVDNDILVVGAIDGELFIGDQGRAYVFERGAGGVADWKIARKLDPDDLRQQPAFGRSVAVSGDVVAIGDPHFPNGGRVYIYERNAGGAGNWGRVGVLDEDDGFGQQNFGVGITLSGPTLVVGARGHNAAGSDAGATFVYDRDGGNWVRVKTITASNAQSFRFFGDSPSLVGDLLFVGNSSFFPQGTVYHFLRNEGGVNNWGELGQFSSTTMPLISDFGSFNATSRNTLVVGAPNRHPAQEGPGQAFIYRIGLQASECVLQALPLTFGDIDTGLTVNAAVGLTNAGSQPCSISAVTLTGDPQFTLVNPPALPLTIDADHSASINVSYAPPATGDHSGTIVITSDDAQNPSRTVAITASSVSRCNVSIDPRLPIVFDNAPFGLTATRAIRLENLGAEDCIVSSVELNACCTGSFSLGPGIPATPFVLTRGAPVISSVSYTPATTQLETATLDIASTDANEPMIRLWLRGWGPNRCLLVPEDNQPIDGALDFGDVEVSQSTSRVFQTRNRGSQNCHFLEREVTGSSAFGVPPDILFGPVPPDTTVTWTFDFAPARRGPHDAMFRITELSMEVFDLRFTGNALPSQDCDMQIDASILDFGDVAVGASAVLPLFLTNEGLSDCVVTGLTLSGSNEFNLSGPPLPIGMLVDSPPVMLTLSYAPADNSADSGALTVASSDPFDPAQVVSLSGRDVDTDDDGTNDLLDNCQLVANPTQLDADGDGFGNLCDQDLNNDCRVNFPDLNIFISMYLGCCELPADFNGDTRVNLSDLALMRAVFFGAPGPSGVNTICDL